MRGYAVIGTDISPQRVDIFALIIKFAMFSQFGVLGQLNNTHDDELHGLNAPVNEHVCTISHRVFQWFAFVSARCLSYEESITRPEKESSGWASVTRASHSPGDVYIITTKWTKFKLQTKANTQFAYATFIRWLISRLFLCHRAYSN